jgi:hypothetical protein
MIAHFSNQIAYLELILPSAPLASEADTDLPLMAYLPVRPHIDAAI